MILKGHVNEQEELGRLEGCGHEDLEIEKFEANDKQNSGQLRLNWVGEVAFIDFISVKVKLFIGSMIKNHFLWSISLSVSTRQ